jgi:hypothetical protein
MSVSTQLNHSVIKPLELKFLSRGIEGVQGPVEIPESTFREYSALGEYRSRIT